MNLKIIVMALFGLSSVIDIAEKIHNWNHDKNETREEKKEEPSQSRV